LIPKSKKGETVSRVPFLIWVCLHLDIGGFEAQRRSIEKSLDL